MIRRWREEIAQHEQYQNRPGYRRYNHYDLAPVPPVLCGAEAPCHCYAGPGFMRKRTAFGCGNPRCGICHYEKFYLPKDRFNKRREAVLFELDAVSEDPT